MVDPRHEGVTEFDIISYTWGPETEAYDCGIPGVNWGITLSREKLNDIKRLMVSAPVQYLWVDSVCINQADRVRSRSRYPRCTTTIGAQAFAIS